MALVARPDHEARRVYGLPESVPVGIVIQHDGLALRVARDGSVEPVLPGGWPRPGLSHATARVLP